jgi:hypothetical protein
MTGARWFFVALVRHALEHGGGELLKWDSERETAGYCGHPGCIDALERCAASHLVDDRHFHGRVNVVIADRHLWDRYEREAACRG